MTSYESTKYGCKDSNGYLWYVGVLSSVEPNSHPTALSVRMLWTKCQEHAMIHRVVVLVGEVRQTRSLCWLLSSSSLLLPVRKIIVEWHQSLSKSITARIRRKCSSLSSYNYSKEGFRLKHSVVKVLSHKSRKKESRIISTLA